MDRTFASGAAGSPPSAPASPSSGYPTAGNPGTGTPATKPGPWWYYMMTEEVRSVIVAAGLTPDYTNVGQLAQAIQQLISIGGIKMPVRAATTSNIATLGGGAPNTLDGVTLVANDRILVKDQATGSQNGIYVVTTLGTGANGTWTRATDADGIGELFSGLLLVVNEGTTNGDTVWELSTDGAITIGTTSLSFVRKDAATVLPEVPVRQTVLGGPVDSNGLPSFLPATSVSLTLTSQNIAAGTPLVVAAANGFNSTGALDRVGISTANIAWSGLVANSTNYLYVDVAANGTLTPGSTTVAPIYQRGGTPAVTANQATFNISQMQMFVGNGAAAPQTYRVFVGEAVTGASTVTSSVAYAYAGQNIIQSATLASTTVFSYNHQIGAGIIPRVEYALKCVTANNGYAVGDEVPRWVDGVTGFSDTPIMVAADAQTVRVIVTNTSGISLSSKASAGFVSSAVTNWKFIFRINRGW